MEISIESYSTLDCPDREDISVLLTRHRDHACKTQDLANEGNATLMLLCVDKKAVSSLRYYGMRDDHEKPYIYINLVHTLSEYRGRGYSKMLFDNLPKASAVLDVSADNYIAIGMYTKLGFIRKKYTQSSHIDDVTMIRL